MKKGRRLGWVVGVLVLGALPAGAQTLMTTIGAGDCRDPELASAATSLSSALALQPNVRVMEPATAVGALGLAPTRSVEELQRQVDHAQQQFYRAHYQKALGNIAAAKKEVTRLPPGSTQWGLWVSIHLIEGLVLMRTRPNELPRESFGQVLRLEPDHQLDPDYFGPSTVAKFDEVRREIRAAKRTRLLIKSNILGAEVFLDGRKVGVTPYAGSHVPGRYQLVIARGDERSLPRQIHLDGQPLEVQVDLRFEGALAGLRIPCTRAASDETTRLAHAMKLGGLLEVEQVVLLRFERPSAGAAWLSATLLTVSSGERVREGGLQVPDAGITNEGIAALAQFVATGERREGVLAVPATKPPPPPRGTGGGTGSLGPGIARDGTPANWRRPAGIAGVATGVAFIVGGGLMAREGHNASERFSQMERVGITHETAHEAKAHQDRAALMLPLGYGTAVVGAAAAIAGGVLWWMGPPSGATPSTPSTPSTPGPSSPASPPGPALQVSLLGGPGGAAVSLSGIF